jgi:signal transduction histidine kinase
VEIADDGSGVRAGRGGVGLGSMRERAERLGGQFTIGPGATGGTLVVAVLPVDP